MQLSASSILDQCFISMAVQPWPQLNVIAALIAPNVFLTPAMEIPGVTFMGTPGHDSLENPIALPSDVTCSISKIGVRMRPDVTSYELLLQNNLVAEIQPNMKDHQKFRVSKRELKIGLHNGITYISKQYSVPLTMGSDGLLQPEDQSPNDLTFSLPKHPAFVLVFEVEEELSEIPVTSVFKKSQTPKTFHVFLGWAAVCPQEQSGNIQNLVFQSSKSPIGPKKTLFCDVLDNKSDLLLNFTMNMYGAQLPIPAQPIAQPPPVQPVVQQPQMPLTSRHPEPITQPILQPPAQHPSFATGPPIIPQSVIGNYQPIELQHVMDNQSHGKPLVTPVHIPMPPLPPLPTASLPRSAYAQLYSAGFPIIRDRHGDIAQVIDPTNPQDEHLKTFDYAAEKSDPLQGNEITIQFLALSSFSHITTPALDQPQSVFFTMQFYNFAPVKTERLLMTCGDKLAINDFNERLSSMFILRQIDKQSGSLAHQPPGYQVKFAVDSSVLKLGEEDAFWQYLLTQSLHIDVWDGDSLMLVGSATVPVRFLLRQGKEAIQMTLELDVFSTEYGSLTSNIIADVTRSGSARYIDVAAVLKGRLHIRLANIGYVSDMRPIVGKTALAKLYGGSSGRLAVVESQNSINNSVNNMDKRLNFLSDKTNRPITGRTRIGHGAHILEAAGTRAVLDMTSAQAGVQASELMGAAGAGESLDERARKLEKFKKIMATQEGKEAASSQMAHGAAVVAYKHAKESRESSYQNLESYRNRMKHQTILGLLSDAITSHHEVKATFGKAEYFEFLFKNPTNEQHMVRIESQDPDLQVVTDISEWKHFRKAAGESTSELFSSP